METLWADVRVSLRQLAKTPGFTAAAVSVLALGIGLNAVMFGLVYAIGFAGRAYPEPHRLMQLYSSRNQEPDSYRAFSYGAYQELVAQGDLFSGLLAHNPTIIGVRDSGADSRRTFGVVVSRNYFEVLGVPVIQGRGFTEEESRPGIDIPVAVATWAYWQRTGFDPALVGKTVRVNERAFTVIGITPRGFTGTMTTFGPEWFFPLGVFHSISNDFEGESSRTLLRPDAYNLFISGRLKDGVSVEAATSRLAAAGPALARAFPAEYRDARITMAPQPRFGTSTSPNDERVVALLGALMLGLTAAVLLTVCLNLASMLLARGRARRKELAIRLALGSGRSRIVRQLLTEGLLLSLAGGVIGVALGLMGMNGLGRAFASIVPITFALEGTSPPSLVAPTILFSVVATTWFALGPALRFSRGDVVTDLKPSAGEDTPDVRRAFLPRNPLLVGQVALSLALLIAAGLFIRMAQSAMAIDLGFRAPATVLAEVDTRLGGYENAEAVNLYGRVEQQLAALPGIRSVSVGALVPLGMVNMSKHVRRGGIHVAPGATPQTPETGRAFSTPWNAVSGGYFEAMGVPVLQGRTFSEAESFGTGGRPVAIVDEALVRKLWPDGGALGQVIQFEEKTPAEAAIAYEVVGIVASTRRELFHKEFPGGVYVPFGRSAMGNAFFHVRAAGPFADLESVVRREINTAAPGVPLFSARTFTDHVEQSLEYWVLKVSASIFGTFGVFAVMVALVGIYGVMSYAVERRTREIGIRMAVGAMPQAVRRMILRESLVVTLIGVALGTLFGLAFGRMFATVFVDVPAFDAFTFTLIPAGFILAALAAAWLPARRATRVNPLTALRSE